MKNVLILEDDQIVQRLYKRIFQNVYKLHIVGTVEEAKRALDETRPDLFVSDMRLPDGSGAEAVTMAKMRHPEMPIIVVSGTLEDAADLEVNRKMEKPFSPEALQLEIEALVR